MKHDNHNLHTISLNRSIINKITICLLLGGSRAESTHTSVCDDVYLDICVVLELDLTLNQFCCLFFSLVQFSSFQFSL